MQIHDLPWASLTWGEEGDWGGGGWEGWPWPVGFLPDPVRFVLGQREAQALSLMMIIFSNFFVASEQRAGCVTTSLARTSGASASPSFPLSLYLFLSLSLLLILRSLLQFLWLSRLLASAHVHLNVLGVLKYYYIKGMTESRACLEYPVGEVIWHIKTVDLLVLQ